LVNYAKTAISPEFRGKIVVSAASHSAVFGEESDIGKAFHDSEGGSPAKPYFFAKIISVG
jgi:hypothetical protein